MARGGAELATPARVHRGYWAGRDRPRKRSSWRCRTSRSSCWQESRCAFTSCGGAAGRVSAPRSSNAPSCPVPRRVARAPPRLSRRGGVYFGPTNVCRQPDGRGARGPVRGTFPNNYRWPVPCPVRGHDQFQPDSFPVASRPGAARREASLGWRTAVGGAGGRAVPAAGAHDGPVRRGPPALPDLSRVPHRVARLAAGPARATPPVCRRSGSFREVRLDDRPSLSPSLQAAGAGTDTPRAWPLPTGCFRSCCSPLTPSTTARSLAGPNSARAVRNGRSRPRRPPRLFDSPPGGPYCGTVRAPERRGSG